MSRHDPLHVTMRVGVGIDDLRGPVMFHAVKTAILAGADRFGTRIIEFSVQFDHVHLIVEAPNNAALTSAMRGLCVRLARAINNVMGRKGNVFPDRYHVRALRSPREIRSALIYVLCNRRKHECGRGLYYARDWLDPCSSARNFSGWRGVDSADIAPRELPAPQSWLLKQQYWKKDIKTNSMPKVSKRR